MATPDYGLDAPGLVRKLGIRGAILIVVGILVYVMNQSTNPQGGRAISSICIAAGIACVAVALVMIWSSKSFKPGLRDRILDKISWRGDEKVLDVGCGRGLFLVGAAKRLKTGRATGIDVWRPEDLSGNRAEAALANAKAEGVGDRVKVETGDARKLPFADRSFDVVVSSLAIHNIPDAGDREQALGEMVRVLKPGGRLAILDIFETPKYARALERAGMSDVELSAISFPWCCPTWHVTARKP
ncbi:MAG: class I SAM-dependent methyltransferase [Acidobacteriota bacterium]|nr:class I SAM-dependent methyltransferase [Acidobacteriota bacterium]